MQNQYIIDKLVQNSERIDLFIDKETSEIISVERELFDIKSDKKVNDWKTKKHKNQAIYHSFKRLKDKKKQRLNISLSQIENLKNCGSILDFKLLPDNRKRLKNAYFCRNRFCPICAWRRSLRVANDNNKILTEYLNRNSDNRLLFLTLTVKNCKFNELKETINLLNSSVRRLRRTKEFKKICFGEIKVIEITVNLEEKTFHPHVHLILSVSNDYFKKKNNMYLTHSDWVNLWRKCLKVDYYTFANIKAIQNFKDKEELKYKAISEISKYTVKDSDYLIYKHENDMYIVDKDKTDEVLYYLYTETKNMRFLSYTKVFKEIKKELNIKDEEELTNEDLINSDVESDTNTSNIIVRYLYSYSYSTYLYDSYFIESQQEDN